MRYGSWCFIRVIMNVEILTDVFDFVLKQTCTLNR